MPLALTGGPWVIAASPPLVAAGADGILVEVHPHPDKALSDGAQSLYPEQFMQLVKELHAIANAIGRTIAPTPAITPVVA